MKNIEREDIHIISRHSNWLEEGIDKTLKEKVYHNQKDWLSFLKVFFVSLGVGFITAGIISFFAYNWNDLHKFVKIGLIQGLLIALIAVILWSKFQQNVKNILLTGASVLVGVLMAVFGQVYQTGANAYDLFLNWTLFILLWVVISNFAPLWLLFITLINTTLVLYFQQVAQDWSPSTLLVLLVLINSSFLVLGMIGKQKTKLINPPIWFNNLLALAVVSIATWGISVEMFGDYNTAFVVLVLLTGMLYSYGIWYAYQSKNGFYLAIIPFSLIIIFSAFLLKQSDDYPMFFLVSFFIIAGVSLVIKNLINLQRKWKT